MRRDPTTRLAQVAGLGRVLARELLDTNPVPADWRHVTKVDPEESKRLPLCYPRWLRHTDAVSVGGSRDVTAANTEATFDLLASVPAPVCHEPSGPRHVTVYTWRRADLLLVPEVLNGDVESLVGKLGAGVEYIREEMTPDLLAESLSWLPEGVRDRLADVATTALLSSAAFEAYIVQNVDSAAAREAGVTEADLLSPTEAKRRAMAADRHLDSELVYLEYSGTFGGDEAREILAELDGALDRARVWYGGGLADREDVRAVRDAGADTVVVGDAFHDVAEAEAELLEAAAADLPLDAGHAAIADWVSDELDDDWAGARFLSTTDVNDPVRRAREIAVASVHAWLDLRRVETEVDAPSVEALERAVGDGERLALASALRPAVGDAAAALARELASSVLGSRADLDVDATPATHLGVPDPHGGTAHESEQ